jgi:putative oxidoreductase
MTTARSNQLILPTLLKSDVPEQTGFQLVWTILRIGVGLLMIHNGFSKLADVQGFADNVISVIGFPYPIFSTYCAAYTEIIGAILLAAGLLTRINAAALLFVMLVALYFHLKHDGLKVAPLETASLYAMCFLCFIGAGGGKFSLDALLASVLSQRNQ